MKRSKKSMKKSKYMKECGFCKKSRPLKTSFFASASHTDGYMNVCKGCDLERRYRGRLYNKAPRMLALLSKGSKGRAFWEQILAWGPGVRGYHKMIKEMGVGYPSYEERKDKGPTLFATKKSVQKSMLVRDIEHLISVFVYQKSKETEVATTSDELRKRAKTLEDQAWEMDRAEARKGKGYMVGENIQDESRPRVSGPFTWDEAVAIVRDYPKGVKFICDYGGLLP